MSYYDQPLLKPPVWTWEVPAYFFVGGVAGVAAVIAAVGTLAGVEASLVRDARWVAAICALLSPALLISDLGRPDRFLNMMRVFKARSPMSVGAWTLAAFTPAVLASLVWDPTTAGPGTSLLARLVGHAGSLLGAATGLVLVTYTGVLLGVTAIPVWSTHARTLPVHFGASSLGAAVSVLELLGHRTPAMNALGIAAALVLTIAWVRVEFDRRATSAPLRSGASGRLTRTADLLAGALPLVLRLLWPGATTARIAAAASAILGSVLGRFGWIAAGRASVALALAAMLVAPVQAGRQAGQPDLSTRALVDAAARYVATYHDEFKFLLADEEYTQTLHSEDGETVQQRRLTGELFLTYIPGDRDWIAVHDFATVDDEKIPDRDDVRALLKKRDVRGVAAQIANRNARYNIGRLGRNFNQPTLPLLLLGPSRIKSVAFDRQDVVRIDGRTRVQLGFRERERPTLVRTMRGQPLYSRGTITIDAATGRVERTTIEIESDRVRSVLTTEYAPDERLKLWVPTVFRERYDGESDGAREIIECEARLTNYRRFEVTGRIKY
jgi:hypothetical protein